MTVAVCTVGIGSHEAFLPASEHEHVDEPDKQRRRAVGALTKRTRHIALISPITWIFISKDGVLMNPVEDPLHDDLHAEVDENAGEEDQLGNGRSEEVGIRLEESESTIRLRSHAATWAPTEHSAD